MSEKKEENKYQMLMPLKPSKKAFRFATFDIESSNWVNFELLGFYDGEQYREFESVKKFLEFFLQKRYAFWRIFAHAGGRFDFNFIIDSLDRNFPEFRYQILSGMGISELRVWSDDSNRAWIFKDSYRLLPQSLRVLTKTFEVEHKKQEIDYKNITKDWAKMQEYLKYDVVGLYEVIQKFREWLTKYNVPLQSTLASQSMAMYRTTMKSPISCLPEQVENFVRRTYTGGRVEIFKLRAFKKTYCYDVNSLYPHVMVKYEMPVGKPIYVRQFYEGKIGFYKADVKIPDVYIPPLPTVQHHKLLFPYGRITGYFTSKELDILQDIGGDYNIHYGYVFSGDYIFSDYIRDLYERKKNAKDAMERLLWKLMMNSLYGKTGQSREKEKIVKCNTVKDMLGLKPYDPAHGLFTQETVSKATFIIPSIASWVTSCARFELYQWLKKVGDEHLFYTDTDSVFSDKLLPTGNDLGDMKMEYEADEAIFLLPKLYALKCPDGSTKIKAKGFENSFVKSNLSFKSFERALHGNTLDFKQTMRKFASCKESLRRNGTFLSMIDTKKSIRSQYDKRKVLRNLDTRAWKFPMAA